MSEPKNTAARSGTDQSSSAAEEATSWEHLHPEAVVLVEHLSAEDEDARLRAEADLGDWDIPPTWLGVGA